MIQYPITITNVLPEYYFAMLNDDLTDWQLNNYSYMGGKYSWGIDKQIIKNLSFLSCGSFIKLKIQKIVKQDLKLCKIHTNGQTSNQTSEFHKDFFEDQVWTFVLFCNYSWNTSWGGEFVCFDDVNNKYHYCPLIPNNGILIPSNWDHYGSCPNSSTDKLRVTVAFSYCDPSIYEKIILNCPNCKRFY